MFAFATKFRRHPKLAVFAITAVVGVSSILAPASTALASTYSDMSVDQRSTAYEYARILRLCVSGTTTLEGNESYIKNGRLVWGGGKLYSSWDQTVVSKDSDAGGLKDDNESSCTTNDVQAVREALNYLKIDPIRFACDLGWKRENGSANCVEASGNFTTPRTVSADAVAAAIKLHSGLDFNSPGGSVLYLWNKKVLDRGCFASSLTKAQWDAENDDVKYDLKTDYKNQDNISYYAAKSKKGELPRGANNSEKGAINCRTYWESAKNNFAAYAQYMNSLSPEEQALEEQQQAPEGTTDSTASTCIIEAVGWIVCPVMNFTAGIVDAAYGFVTSLLEVQPLLTTGGSAGIYNAWVVMRNIANVAFVIAFLIIIFSQLTSMGVSNYGVKKLLPRLVIAAILVNVSFWICAIGVDLSNILGSSMVQIFESIQVSIPNETSTGGNFSFLADGNGWMSLVGGVLAGTIAAGAIYYVGLSALIPALLAALVAILTVFLVLTLRQALIVLLIVIAPLAFVAYLLPNTEGWFSKWRKLLMTLLLMYPIIALIFGASALASEIIISTANNNIVIQIMGACIAIVPLALTPLVMKTAGGLLNRFGGIVNNAERGPVDRLKRTSEKYREGRKNLRNSQALSGSGQLGRGKFVRWRARRGAIANGRQSEANRANTEYIADTIQSSDKFQNSVAGGTNGIIPGTTLGSKAANSEAQQRALASAISTKSKLQSDELSSAQIVVKSAQLSQDEVRALTEGLQVEKNGVKLDGASTAIKAAAVKTVVESNDVFQINQLWDVSRTWHGEEGNKLREVFADSLQSSSARPAYIGQGAIAGLRSSTAETPHGDHVSVIEGALKANTYSPEKVVTADKDELAAVDQVRRSTTNLTPEVHAQFNNNITTALTDDKLSVRIGKNRDNIIKIRDNVPIDHLK